MQVLKLHQITKAIKSLNLTPVESTQIRKVTETAVNRLGNTVKIP